MDDLVYYLKHLLFFDILLFYYYINLRSSIMICLFSGDIYLSSGIFLSGSFVTVSDLFCFEVFETFVVLSLYDLATALAILLPIQSPVPSAVSWITPFE